MGNSSLNPRFLVRAGAFLRGFGLNRRQRRRSERRKARARPPCADAGGCSILHHRARPTRRRGQPPREGAGGRTRRGKRSAHANGGRTTAETAGTQGRAPRAQPTATNGSRARERGPLPPLKFPAGCDQREHEGGKGGAPCGRGGGRGTRPRETERSAPPHRQPNAGTAASDSARRRAAGAKQDGKPDDSPPRGRKTERGQRPSRPGRRRRDGQRARKPPHPAPRHSKNATTPADGDTAARRTATAQAGRTGRESPAAAPATSAEKRRNRTPQHARGRRGGRDHGGHGRQHARTPGGGTLRERADGQRAESATGQRQIGGRARDSPDKAAEGSGRSGGAPTASQTPRAARTQRAARPIVARRCGHFRAGGKRGTLPSAFPLPSLVRFRGTGGVIPS